MLSLRLSKKSGLVNISLSLCLTIMNVSDFKWDMQMYLNNIWVVVPAFWDATHNLKTTGVDGALYMQMNRISGMGCSKGFKTFP